MSLYLLPSLNLKLRPTLWKTLKPGTRIVSHDFDMGDWKPEQTLNVDGATCLTGVRRILPALAQADRPSAAKSGVGSVVQTSEASNRGTGPGMFEILADLDRRSTFHFSF